MPLIYNLTRAQTTLHHNGTKRAVKALIDQGSQTNIISPLLAAEIGLKPRKLPNWIFEGPNLAQVTVYGWAEAELEVQDSAGTTSKCNVPFTIIIRI